MVGIWEPNANGSYVRAPRLRDQWHGWASVHRIPPKSTRRRVVLLGESVARGFLYDPAFTPAIGLETILRTAMGPAVEVVDLACDNQRGDGLAKIFEESFTLSPDVIVILAGNNWRKHGADDVTPADLEARAVALRDGGVLGLKRACESQLSRDVEALVEDLAGQAARRQIPVVFVQPEHNLGDWRRERGIVPWMEGVDANAWRAHEARARTALEAGQVVEAAAAAGEMLALDQGVCAYGLFVLAECARRGGRWAEARRYFEQRRDSMIWDPFSQVPANFTAAMQTLRRTAGRHKLPIVDLARVFDLHLGGQVPGRRLFLDYCHLTLEGIRVAMAAIAEAVLPLLGGPRTPWVELARTPIVLDPEVEAQAHFAAAIHHAHWGTDDEIVDHHCREAIARSPQIKIAMRQFVDLVCQGTPGRMCPTSQKLLAGAKIHYLVNIVMQTRKNLDRDFVGILARHLDCAVEIERQYIEGHGRMGEPTSLLKQSFSVTSVTQREAFWMINGPGEVWPSYFQAYDKQSTFVVIEEGPATLVLELAARLPAGEGVVRVEVNGTPVFEGLVGAAWTSITMRPARELVRAGFNEVTVSWPAPTAEAAPALARAADDLAAGRTPELYPVFGEIHSLVARDA